MGKHVTLLIVLLCFSLIVTGCPKKSVVKGTPSSTEMAAEAREAERRETEAEKEKLAKLEAERREKEAKEAERLKAEEAARIREQEAMRMKEEEARRLREEEARKLKEDEARKLKEDEARRLREEQARKQKEEEAKKAAAAQEFERSLMAKRVPGIEGEVYESRLLKDVYFDFDRYDIRPGEAEVLKENAALLMKYPRVKVQIEGHCDERGTREYNLALGQRRASSAKKYLVSLGIPEERILTISYGEERPFSSGSSEDAWAKNRRAHFIILSK